MFNGALHQAQTWYPKLDNSFAWAEEADEPEEKTEEIPKKMKDRITEMKFREPDEEPKLPDTPRTIAHKELIKQMREARVRNSGEATPDGIAHAQEVERAARERQEKRRREIEENMKEWDEWVRKEKERSLEKAWLEK